MLLVTMLGCYSVSDRKQVPEAERVLVASIVHYLTTEQDDGRKRYSQGALGTALGGLSQEAIRKAREPDGVTVAIRDRLREFAQRGTIDDVPGVLQLVASGVKDTLSMADQAAKRLSEERDLKPTLAWRLMRGIRLNAPTIEGFLEEAKRRLKREPDFHPEESMLLDKRPGPAVPPKSPKHPREFDEDDVGELTEEAIERAAARARGSAPPTEEEGDKGSGKFPSAGGKRKRANKTSGK